MFESLAELARASADLWLPVLAWTAVAVVAEAALRVSRASAALALPVRGSVLAALPVAVVVPAALAAFAPETAAAFAFAPDVAWLPGVTVGAPEPALVPLGPAPGEVAAGLLVGLAALLAAVRLGQFAVAVVGAQRTRRRLPHAGPAAQAAVDTARDRLGVARAVAAAQAPTGAAPFTLGWRRPVVALPPDLGAEAREVAAVHEVAHVRRGDYAWHAAQRLVAAAFAAHPLVGVLARGLDLDRERAADAAVLAACPGRRRAYADLLFSYAALPAPPLALGAVGGSSSLKTRIDAMTRPASPAAARRHGWAGRLAGLALALVVALASAATAPAPAEAGAPSSATALSPRPIGAAGATTGTPPDTTEIVEVAEVMPQMVGGLDGLMARLEYPELAKRAGIQGRVIVQFVVDPEGRVVAPEATRSPHEMLSRAAIEAVRETRFTPGRQDGQAVATRFAVPITFVLPEDPAGEPDDTVRRVLPDPQGQDGVYGVVDEMPRLVGGIAGLQERLVYPPLARDAGIEGRVVVQFVVNELGRVEDAVVTASPHEMLSEAALQAVRASEFEPGRVDGRAVKVRFAVPVTFRLPAGDGVDRGEARPRPEDLRRRLPSSGTDLTLLANQAGFRARHVRGLSVLDATAAAAGTATVRYTILPNGRTTDLRMAEDTPDGKLGDLARALVAMMTFEADRRPPVPYADAMFRLDYTQP